MSQPAIAAPTPSRRTPPSGNKPGDFYARCALTRRVAEKKLTPTELREAREAGHPRIFDRAADDGRGRFVICYPACAGFESTDRAAFAEHMRTEHGRGPSYLRGEAEAFAASINAGWKAPRLYAKGKDLPKAAAEQLEECPTCELKAQVDTLASEQWWREHLRGCALAQAGVAS